MKKKWGGGCIQEYAKSPLFPVSYLDTYWTGCFHFQLKAVLIIQIKAAVSEVQLWLLSTLLLGPASCMHQQTMKEAIC